MGKRSNSANISHSALRRRRILIEPMCDSETSDENSDVEALSRNDRCPRCLFSICICSDHSTRAYFNRNFPTGTHPRQSQGVSEEPTDLNFYEGEPREIASIPPVSETSPIVSTYSRSPSTLPLSAAFNVDDVMSGAVRSAFNPSTFSAVTRNTVKQEAAKQDQGSQTDETGTSSRQAQPSTSSGPALLESSLTNELHTLHSNLLSILECPVCLEYVVPPISQCRRGHLICQRCKPQLVVCPTCRERFAETRNLAMEKVAERLMFPCKNASSGCTTQSLLNDKESHENNCEFRSYSCVFRSCLWSGILREYFLHLKERHASRLLVGERQVISFALGSPTSFVMDWIVYCHNELFRVNVFQNIPRCQLFALVQYFGPSAKASRYFYTLELERSPPSEPRRKLSYCRTTHSHLSRLSASYAEADCLTLKVDAVNHFATNGDIVFSVHIEEN